MKFDFSKFENVLAYDPKSGCYRVISKHLTCVQDLRTMEVVSCDECDIEAGWVQSYDFSREKYVRRYGEYRLELSDAALKFLY
jgi:hypothetical protein